MLEIDSPFSLLNMSGNDHTVTRSGKRYRKVTYVKQRRGVIGMTAKQYNDIFLPGEAAGFDDIECIDLKLLWRLFSAEETVSRLDKVCPGHGYKANDLKVPMLILWLKHQPMKQNQEALQRKEMYPRPSLYKLPRDL